MRGILYTAGALALYVLSAGCVNSGYVQIRDCAAHDPFEINHGLVKPKDDDCQTDIQPAVAEKEQNDFFSFEKTVSDKELLSLEKAIADFNKYLNDFKEIIKAAEKYK